MTKIISEEELLSQYIPVSRRTLHTWKKQKLIPVIKVPGSRRCLYDPESVMEAMKKMQQGGKA